MKEPWVQQCLGDVNMAKVFELAMRNLIFITNLLAGHSKEQLQKRQF